MSPAGKPQSSASDWDQPLYPHGLSGGKYHQPLFCDPEGGAHVSPGAPLTLKYRSYPTDTKRTMQATTEPIPGASTVWRVLA